MFKRLVSATLLLALAVSFVGPVGAGTALAAETGPGPAQASAPVGLWTELGVGDELWYGFEYVGNGSQIAVWLDAVPANGAAFAIWTPKEVERWAHGEAVEPVGRGSPDEYAPGDLSWSGNFNQPGTYYIVVQNAGSEVCYISVHAGGSGVSTLPAAAAETATVATETEKPVVVEPEAVVGDGVSPDTAFAAPSHAVTIAQEASAWHKFSYAGDESQILIWLVNEGGSSLAFSVWTPEQVRQWDNGVAVEPVGRGSGNPYAPGDLSWSGNFNLAGTYYVRIDAGTTAGRYTLHVEGSGIW